MNGQIPESTTHPLINSWSHYPIPNLSLSAGALIALADLQTIAQRTVLTGGSSWLDALVLAPGLHYQQAADALERHFQHGLAAPATAVESRGQDRYDISNPLVLDYMRRLCAEAKVEPITLDIDLDTASKEFFKHLKGLFRRLRRKSGLDKDSVDLDWFSHLLYLASPLLTISAITFTILLAEWWALGTIVALMLARIFNIYIIKERSKPIISLPSSLPPHLESSPHNDTIVEYTVDLGQGRRVLLRGRPADLHAITTQVWLRDKTHVEGFLEAAAKLLVYLVAALSGNLTQAGSVVLMALMLASAGLLGLSNAQLKGFRMHGRVARFELERSASDSGILGKSSSSHVRRSTTL